MNFIALLVLFIVFSGLALSYLNFFKGEEFKVSFLAYSTAISPQIVSVNIKSFQDLIEAKDYTSLSKNLSLPISDVKSLKYFETKIIDDEINNVISVDILGQDSLVLAALPERISNFFKNDKFYSQSADLIRENLIYSKKRLQTELDSSKEYTNEKEVIIFNSNQDFVELLQMKQKIDINLSNFSTFSKMGNLNVSAIRSSMTQNLIASLLFGLVLSVLFVWGLEFLRFLGARMNQYDSE